MAAQFLGENSSTPFGPFGDFGVVKFDETSKANVPESLLEGCVLKDEASVDPKILALATVSTECETAAANSGVAL